MGCHTGATKVPLECHMAPLGCRLRDKNFAPHLVPYGAIYSLQVVVLHVRTFQGNLAFHSVFSDFVFLRRIM